MNDIHHFDAVDDESIFRYLKFDHFKDFIEKSALYFSRMDLMSDTKEGLRYKNGGVSNTVYGSCWRMKDLGNFKKLFKEYKCENGIIIKTSVASLRDSFNVFARSRHTNVAWGLYFPYVIFAKVKYVGKKCEEIDIGTDDIETMCSQLCWNMDQHFLPFLFKMKKFKFEKEMRIFTRWQTITMNGPSFLSECALFKKNSNELPFHHRCTSLEDILYIENKIKEGNVLNISEIDQMQPIGFFYPISLNIIEAIYTQESNEDDIKNLLIKSDCQNLLSKLITL